ncbi:MAG: Kelch repeat-containing protein [Candidatus Helarchaeota archaeon]
MSTTRVGFGILVLTSGKVLVAGGETASGVITTLAEIYDPTNNSWTQTGSMHDARSGFGMVLLDNGEILVAGGSIYGMALNTAEIYDPSTGTWSRTGSMHDGVYGAGFALFTSSTSEKKVLRAGGIGSSGNILSTAEIYTPSTGTWTRTASMRDSRTGFGIVKLPNGNIFVAGGKAGLQGSVILSTTEEYIVSSGKWNKRPSMYDARCGFNLLLLNNGDILAAGGMNLYSSLSTAELYEP